MGGLPNTYPGYQYVTDKTAQQKFENAWASPFQTGSA